MKKEGIIIFTDGASRGNPGPGGWGAIVVSHNDVHELGGGEHKTTNNRMELTAVIEALVFASKIKAKNSQSEVIVNTDSSYVLKGATLWAHGWKKNGWKTKTKGDVLNKDLWEKFLKVSTGLKISWHLLKGHSGVASNERCDEIATSFADQKKPKLYSGVLKNYRIDISISSGISKATNHKQKARSSKAKPYSYVSSVQGVVKTHATWAECEARVKGKSGALFKKSFSPENEKSIIASWKK